MFSKRVIPPPKKKEIEIGLKESKHLIWKRSRTVKIASQSPRYFKIHPQNGYRAKLTLWRNLLIHTMWRRRRRKKDWNLSCLAPFGGSDRSPIRTDPADHQGSKQEYATSRRSGRWNPEDCRTCNLVHWLFIYKIWCNFYLRHLYELNKSRSQWREKDKGVIKFLKNG